MKIQRNTKNNTKKLKRCPALSFLYSFCLNTNALSAHKKIIDKGGHKIE